MGRDCDLLTAAESGQCLGRVYSWDGVWVSLGRNQSASDALVDPDETRWVMRPTGGSAVLHGHDITVSLGRPLPFQRSGGVRDSYRFAAEPLIEALNRVGVPAALAEDLGAESEGRERLPDCFANTSKNDIVDRRTLSKICGCALRRTRTAVLMQASIPVQPPSDLPGTWIRGALPTAVTPLDPQALAQALSARLRP